MGLNGFIVDGPYKIPSHGITMDYGDISHIPREISHEILMIFPLNYHTIQ